MNIRVEDETIQAPVKLFKITKVEGESYQNQPDLIVVEEPLEIRIGYSGPVGRKSESIAVTMRTPGNDFDLVTGFLLSEGIINSVDDILKLRNCSSDYRSENVVIAELSESVSFDPIRFKRNFYTTSSCGICGKASIESVECKRTPFTNTVAINPDLIRELPKIIREHQVLYKHTGGIHGSALLDSNGRILLLREDIGRHNALDKLIGAAAAQKINVTDKILFLSGRSGFELIQKAAVAGINSIVSVGAPSSLAIETAVKINMNLIGFIKKDKFNIYNGAINVELINNEIKVKE